MHEVTGQILSVEGKLSKNGQSTYYDVALSDGKKYRTFDADLANTANALTGQQVSAHVDVVQNGKYTNYNLENIAPQGQLAPLPVLAGTTVPMAGNGASPIPMAGAITPIPITSSADNDAAKDKRITKLAVLRTSFTFVASLFEGAGPEAIEQAQETALGLAKTLFAQVYPPQADAVPPATPAEVAASVPGVEVGTEQVAAAATAKPGPEW